MRPSLLHQGSRRSNIISKMFRSLVFFGTLQVCLFLTRGEYANFKPIESGQQKWMASSNYNGLMHYLHPGAAVEEIDQGKDVQKDDDNDDIKILEESHEEVNDDEEAPSCSLEGVPKPDVETDVKNEKIEAPAKTPQVTSPIVNPSLNGTLN